MTISPGTLQQSIAANKFYPPRINPKQSIPRHHIISEQLAEREPLIKCIVIEAQAGQGKTTLVHQYLEHCDYPFVWYQIGTEDHDPILFLSALHLALTRKLQGFQSSQLLTILEEGQVGPMDLQGCANVLLNDLETVLKDDLIVVLDDLHLIQKSPYTNNLIDHLLDTSPPQLHFMLTSRHPLQSGAKVFRKQLQAISFGSSALALDAETTELFCSRILGLEVTRPEAAEIRRITNGWIMGVVLAAHSIVAESRKRAERTDIGDSTQLLAREKDGHILGYFQDEIFSHIPARLHDAFLILSFLDEIDLELASLLVDLDDIDNHLDSMANENYFIYRLEGETQVFRLHHLFQDFLQILGKERLERTSLDDIYRRAADYYLGKNQIEKGLKTLRNSSDYSRMEDILKEHGLHLLAANRTVTILEILKSIPREHLFAHSWLTFYHGLLSRDFAPQETLPYFESCCKQFNEEQEEVGELMSLSQIIYFHFVISGNYLTGSTLLERTRALFERNNKYLPADISIMVARNLAAGYCVFDGEMDLARHYAQLGCDLATRRESKNFLAATRFVLGYVGLLGGDRRIARGEIEKSLALASDPLVGMSNRLTLHIMQLCELSMHGNFGVFLHQKELIQERVDQKIVRQTVAAPYLFVWSGIELIGRGDHDRALEVLEMGMLVSETASSGHMASQFLQWRALIRAIKGRETEALRDIDESNSLREEAGGAFYVAYHLAIRGATLSFLGRFTEARQVLSDAMQKANDIPSSYPRACCLAYLASLSVQENDLDGTIDYLESWLELMRKERYTYFWGWTPESILPLLCKAVELDIEPDYARMLGRNRLGVAFKPDGNLVPLLKLNILGTFSIGLDSDILFGPQDFSANQRELFGLLIASPQQRVSQEQVQLLFWPDSPPDRARNAFDTLMTRLRKSLSEHLPVSAKEYLNIEKGYVQLSNVTIDGIEFSHLARQGFKLGKQGLWWQAGTYFYNALSCWHSFTPLESFYSDEAVSLYDELQDTLRAVVLEWGSKLAELQRVDEAIAILEKVTRFLSSDEDYIGLLYQLYLDKHSPLKARDLLNTYRQELLGLDYSKEEIEDAINSLVEQSGLR